MVIVFKSYVPPNELPAGAITLDDGEVRVEVQMDELIEWIGRCSTEMKERILDLVMNMAEFKNLFQLGPRL